MLTQTGRPRSAVCADGRCHGKPLLCHETGLFPPHRWPTSTSKSDMFPQLEVGQGVLGVSTPKISLSLFIQKVT